MLYTLNKCLPHGVPFPPRIFKSETLGFEIGMEVLRIIFYWLSCQLFAFYPFDFRFWWNSYRRIGIPLNWKVRLHLIRLGSSCPMCVCVCMLSHVHLFVTPEAVSCQAPLPIVFPRQEYWSELPFPSPGDLPDQGMEPMWPISPALQADSLPLSHWGKK